MLPERSRRILIVDDDRETCLALSFLMESWGYVPLVTHTVDGAVALCREIAFDCLLLDNSLGSEEGTDIITRLRESGADKPLCTILFSGHEPHRFRAWLDAGEVDAFLRKPVRPFELHATIDACLAPRSGAG